MKKSYTIRGGVIQQPVIACTIKHFKALIYGFLYEAGVFVPGKPLQPSLMFAGKARAYPSEAPEVFHSRVAPDLSHKH